MNWMPARTHFVGTLIAFQCYDQIQAIVRPEWPVLASYPGLPNIRDTSNYYAIIMNSVHTHTHYTQHTMWHTHTHTHTHTYTHTYAYTHTHTHTYARTHTHHTHSDTTQCDTTQCDTHTHTHTRVHTHTHTWYYTQHTQCHTSHTHTHTHTHHSSPKLRDRKGVPGQEDQEHTQLWQSITALPNWRGHMSKKIKNTHKASQLSQTEGGTWARRSRTHTKHHSSPKLRGHLAKNTNN